MKLLSYINVWEVQIVSWEQDVLFYILKQRFRQFVSEFSSL